MVTFARMVCVLMVVSLGGVSSAFADVTFNPADGTGFVGRGDVLSTLGKNAVAAPGLVSFIYSDEVTYDIPCKKETKKQTMTKTFTRHGSVQANVSYSSRTNNGSKLVVTGYVLTGYGSISTGGNLACPGGWEADGAPVLISSTGGGLTVWFQGVSALLWAA